MNRSSEENKIHGAEEILWPNKYVNTEAQGTEISSLQNFEKFFKMRMARGKGIGTLGSPADSPALVFTENHQGGKAGDGSGDGSGDSSGDGSGDGSGAAALSI